jgi:hypothetical protein
MQDGSDKKRRAEENETVEPKEEIKHEGIDHIYLSTFVVQQSVSF